jgi:hypothetical protein
MKTILFTFVALVVSAQVTEPFVVWDPVYFTDGHLNGHWWANATPMERDIYRRAWADGAGARPPFIPSDTYKMFHLEPSVSVREAIKFIQAHTRE